MRETIFNHELFKRDIASRRIIHLGLSLRDCANEIGISAATLNRIESGKTPDVETFLKCLIWLNSNAEFYTLKPLTNRK